MNATPVLADWGEWLVRLALGSAGIVIAAVLAARWVRDAGWQRTLWRGCVLGLAVFVIGESFGIGTILTSWVEGAPRDERMAAFEPAAQAQPPRAENRPRLLGQREAPAQLTLAQAEPRDDAARHAIDEPEETPANVWWPGLLWLAGTGLLLMRFAVGRGLLCLLRRRCQPLMTGPIVERVQSVADRLGMRRSVLILQARGPLGPAAFGVWRPTLILPNDFDKDFVPPAQEAMLAHEVAHLAARDAAWQVVADLVTAVLWWQPLAWWARCRLHAAGEAAADDASLVVADGPGLLATCLVELGRRLSPTRRPAWLGAAGTGFRSGLGRRVERLLHLERSAWQPPPRVRAAAAVILAMLVLGGGTVFATSWTQSHIFSEGDETMKNVHLSWKRSLGGIVLLSTFAIGAEPAWAEAAQQNTPAVQKPKKATPPAALVGPGGDGVAAPDIVVRIPRGPEAAGDPDGGVLTLKVFRLKHRDPEAVANIAHTLIWGEPLPQMPAPGVGGEAPGLDRGVGQMPPGGDPFGGRGGAAAFGAMPAASAARFAVDKRTGTLIVRGQKKEVQLVADLVAVLDLPADKQAPKVKNLHVFRLKHADPKTLGQVFDRLEIRLQLAVDSQTRSLIVFADGGDNMQEIRQVVEALDVATPATEAGKK